MDTVSWSPSNTSFRKLSHRLGFWASGSKSTGEAFRLTKRGVGGSGLGLHVVYNLVTRRLGGQIQVASTAGQGTCFTLRIPRIVPQPPEEAM